MLHNKCGDCYKFSYCTKYEVENRHKVDKHGVWVKGAISPIRRCQHAICEKYFTGIHSKDILEVGCGSSRKGFFVKEAFIKNKCTWEGIDIKATDLTTVVCSVEDMPFQDSSFDCVIGNQTIEHWGDIDRSLSEIHRVLADDGKVYLTAPVHLHGRKEFVCGDFEVVAENFERNGFSINLAETWRKYYDPLMRYSPSNSISNWKKINGSLPPVDLFSYVVFYILTKNERR